MNLKHIIIILIIIVLIIFAGLVGSTMLKPSEHDKAATKLFVTSNNTLYEWENVTVKLVDSNSTGMEGQSVEVVILDSNGTRDSRSVVTNSSGEATLALDKPVGNYTLNCTYAGNENYTGSNVLQRLFIIEEVIIEPVQNYTSNYTSQYSNSTYEEPYSPYQEPENPYGGSNYSSGGYYRSILVALGF